MRTITVLVIAFLSSSSAWAQAVPQMRTPLPTGLTNTEIEQYLKRNDVIFVPVGTVEPHGGLPIDCEYVGPLAYAIKMAEATDGRGAGVPEAARAFAPAAGIQAPDLRHG